MMRYRVVVSIPQVHFVDADNPEDAADAGIALAGRHVEPAYALEPSADVDVVADHFSITEGVGSGNTAAGPGGASDSVVTSASSVTRHRQTVEPSQASAPTNNPEKASCEHVNIGSCKSGDCGGSCMICCLFVCAVCGLYEGALTTDCPGVRAMDKSDEIYNGGNLDFRNGEWVNAPNPTHQTWNKYKKPEAL